MAVGIPRTPEVYGLDVPLIPPGGRKRRPVPDREPRAAEGVLAEPRRRRGTEGTPAVRVAAARVRVGDGPTFADDEHLPGDEV